MQQKRTNTNSPSALIMVALTVCGGCVLDEYDLDEAQPELQELELATEVNETVANEQDSDAYLSATEEMKAVTPQCTQAVGRITARGRASIPAANNGSTSCWMDQGNVSAGVQALQRALVYCWHLNISVDSQYGPQTKEAVRAVQRREHIKDDGVYGPQTHAAMYPFFANPLFDECD